MRDEIQSPEDFRELLGSAVALRLRSDVPVGVCLSGGLDSSSIVSLLLKNHQKKDLQTFSAVYGEGVYGDESKFINEFKKELNNFHYTFPSAYTLLADMSNFVNAQTEPTPSTSPYAQYKVMELAKNNVVVTLDGQGADELLAGYHYFYGYYFKDYLLKLRWLRLVSESFYYFKNHKSIYGFKTFLFFLLPSFLKTKLRVAENDYLVSEFFEQYSKGSVIADKLYGSSGLNDALINHFEYKLEHLLKWEDHNSMYFSLESRVPFLDHRLVERTLALPPEQVINKGLTKYILREAMKSILPKSIRTRQDKLGFDTPQDEWFRTKEFQGFIGDILHANSFQERGVINAEKAKKLYQKHLNREINISKDIWKWLNLELWFRQFVE